MKEIIQPKIDENIKNKIYVIKKKITENNWILMDHNRLLYDWLCAMENNFFFASSWVFYVFIEKYLRDLLIKTELQEQKPNFSERDLLSEIDKIERSIEDEKTWFRPKYSFNKICTELKLSDSEYEGFTKLYKNFRNPIQHWIYQRLSKNSINWSGGLSIEIPVTIIDVENVNNIEDLEEIPTDKLNITHQLPRWFILPQVMFTESCKMLDFINQLITKYPIYSNWTKLNDTLSPIIRKK